MPTVEEQKSRQNPSDRITLVYLMHRLSHAGTYSEIANLGTHGNPPPHAIH